MLLRLAYLMLLPVWLVENLALEHSINNRTLGL